MNISESLVIIKKLANGVNPYTGKTLPSKSVCQRPETVRALFVAIDALKQVLRFQERQKSGPAKAGVKWEKSEDALLISGFNSRKSIPQLAALHQRTEQAIRSRLIKLGLLKE